MTVQTTTTPAAASVAIVATMSKRYAVTTTIPVTDELLDRAENQGYPRTTDGAQSYVRDMHDLDGLPGVQEDDRLLVGEDCVETKLTSR